MWLSSRSVRSLCAVCDAPRCLRCSCVEALNATVGCSRRRCATHCAVTAAGTRSILFSTSTSRFAVWSAADSRPATCASTALLRQPFGSRASRMKRTMSESSITFFPGGGYSFCDVNTFWLFLAIFIVLCFNFIWPSVLVDFWRLKNFNTHCLIFSIIFPF